MYPQQSECFLPDALEPERVLNFAQLVTLSGLSKATLRRLHTAGQLPPAIRLSERRLGFRVRDVLAWLAARDERTPEAG